jgi:hypothetical protein
MGNNLALLERDFQEFKPLFASMGVSAGLQNLDGGCQVTYVLRRDIEADYRDRGAANSDIVLIVDEVDDLIVDGSPNTAFVETDATDSANLGIAFDALEQGRMQRPPEVSDALWREARGAYQESRTLEQMLDKPGGYTLVNGRPVLLDDRQHRTDSWSLAREALDYRLARGSGRIANPVVKSTFIVQSMPHIFAKVGNLWRTSTLAGVATIFPPSTSTFAVLRNSWPQWVPWF